MNFDKIYSNSYSSIYSNIIDLNTNSILIFVDSIFGKKDKFNILDVGFGDGQVIESLLSEYRNAKIYGIDSSISFYEKLTGKLCNVFSDRIFLECIDFLEYKSENTFDIIISSNVFHHFSTDDRLKGYKAIHSFLNPDGVFIYCDITTVEQKDFLNILNKIVLKRIEKSELSLAQKKFRRNHLQDDNLIDSKTTIELLHSVGFNKAEIFVRSFNQTIWLIKK